MTHLLISAAVAVLAALGLFEWVRHHQRLASITIRIHVNGTRGKSSVTRLLAGALREAGIRVVARTTGTEPRHILEDGTEQRIERRGNPRIVELVDTVRLAASRGAEAIIVECMALRPEYQRVSEQRLLRSTHGVITNVRDDHLEVMGPSLRDAAESFCSTMPRKGVVVTGERSLLPVLSKGAAQRGSRIVCAAVEPAAWSRLAGGKLHDFPENINVALALCRELGIPEEVALRGIRAAHPDPGALRSFRISTPAGTVAAIDAFSANDPTSTHRIVQGLRERGSLPGKILFLYNHRADRAHRGLAFCPFFLRSIEEFALERLVIVGAGTLPIVRQLLRMGFPAGKIKRRRRIDDGASLMQGLLSGLPAGDCPAAAGEPIASVVGIGNWAGVARLVVRHWERSAAAHV
jgi:gamma-polyglutamate synthase